MATKLYVGNLPYSTTKEDLVKMFSEAGNVLDATIITFRDTGRSKGFGFVEMGSEEDAQKAIAKINGLDMEGRKVVVDEARPMAPRE